MEMLNINIFLSFFHLKLSSQLTEVKLRICLHNRLILPSYLFSWDKQTNILYTFLVLPVFATYTGLPTVLDSITLMVFGERQQASRHCN